MSASVGFRRFNAPFYHFMIGNVGGTVISDGPLQLGSPEYSFGMDKKELLKLLKDHFLSPEHVLLQQNALLVDTGSFKVLFDTGMGFSRKYGWRAGQLLRNLVGAGVDPREINAVALSHGHIDHIGGLVDQCNKLIFPNATIFISQKEFEYWTSETDFSDQKPPEFVEHARWNLLPYYRTGNLRFISDKEEFLPGVTSLLCSGHTVGHTVYSIASEEDSLLFLGDLVHHPILLLQRSFAEFAYDTNALQAVISRVKLLQQISSLRTRVLGYHFPWPGLGHISEDKGAPSLFQYFPEPMELSEFRN